MNDLARRVLDAVDTVPAGRVVTYGDIADLVGASPRAVGRIMAVHGSEVAWHRVVMSTGAPARHLAGEQLRLLRAEGTALRAGRVDLAAAHWRLAPVRGRATCGCLIDPPARAGA